MLKNFGNADSNTETLVTWNLFADLLQGHLDDEAAAPAKNAALAALNYSYEESLESFEQHDPGDDEGSSDEQQGHVYIIRTFNTQQFFVN